MGVVMRFVAGLMLVGGLLVAGGANAVDRGNYNISCTNQSVPSVQSLSGNVGDTFTVTSTSQFTCYTNNFNGVITGPVAFNSGQPYTFTFAAAGTTAAEFGTGVGPQFNQVALTLNITSTAPASIPTLSEWGQIFLGLMTIMLLGWHFHRERSY